VKHTPFLQLVEETVKRGEFLSKTLALADSLDDIGGLSRNKRILLQHLPMVEHALRESLSSSVGAEIGGESEGLSDGKVSLDLEDGGSRTLHLLDDVSTAAVENSVDSSHSALGAGDVDKVDGLHEAGLSSQLASLEATTSSGHDLSGTTMDGIGVEDDILHVEADSTHVLVGHGSFLGHPLEGSNHRVLDLVQVLDGLGHINEDVGAGGLGSEAPDLAGIVDIPAVGLGQMASADLGVVTGVDLAFVDLLLELLIHGHGNGVDTVVLVGGLGEALHGRLGRNGLTVGDDGVGNLDLGSSHEVLLEILDADFQVKLSGSGDDVLTRLLDGARHKRVGLGETLETLDELGKIGGVLALDGATHDRGHGELHGAKRAHILVVGDGSGLGDELIDSGKENGVTARNGLDGLLLSGHLDHDTLDVLDVKVILLSGGVVGSKNADLESGADSSGEHTSESEETRTIGGGNHLGDVEEERTVGVAAAESNTSHIVGGTLVEGVHTVSLGLGGGRQMDDHHLEETTASREPALHATLHEGLLAELLVLLGEGNSDSLEELVDLLDFVVHGGHDDGADGLNDELDESALKGLARGRLVLEDPLLGLGIEEVISPETLGHLLVVNTELLGVHASELGEGEGPGVETGGESDGSLLSRDGHVSHSLITVGLDDDVHVLDFLLETLEHGLSLKLELKESTVELVDGDDGLDTLSKSLTKHSLGLHRHTLDAINHDESSVGDTKSRGNLSREIDVSGRIDQVDQKLGSLGLRDVDNTGTQLILDVEVEGDTSRLDGDGAGSLIGTGVGETLLSGLLVGNDTGSRDERVGKGGLSVIDVSNHRHVPDVGGAIHDGTHLLDCELNHCSKVSRKRVLDEGFLQR